MDDSNDDYVNAILKNSHEEHATSAYKDETEFTDSLNQEAKIMIDHGDKHSANWTATATQVLLQLYASKIEMLENPKKKTAMWTAISENLKDFNIEMSPNQVRWKINALTQKYKQCLHSGQHDTFKYFRELDHIYGQYYNDNEEPFIVPEWNGRTEKKKRSLITLTDTSTPMRSIPESRSMIELRKIRLANKIESDKNQSKVQVEKQWLEYLKRQEDYKIVNDDVFERNLKLKAEELELKKRELELRETLEYRKLQQKEREHDEMIQIEREKCEILRCIVNSEKIKKMRNCFNNNQTT